MNKGGEVLAAINEAFGRTPRPEHFTDYRHCEECAEHDETFRSHTPQSIGFDELGNMGWDPVCFVSVEGYRYSMPAFARLVLNGGEDRETPDGLPYCQSYLDQFLFHLSDERIESFDEAQRNAVLSLLLFVADEMPEEVDRTPDDERLLEAIERLSGVAGKG
jgi:hypothetical protein